MLEKAAHLQATIIIPVWNNRDMTANCLRSIADNTSGVSAEVVAVDNASTDGTREMLLEMQKARVLRCIANYRNKGFSKACNQGARAAQGKYLVFLNNDTLVTPGWLDALMSCEESSGRIGAVGAKLLYKDGLVQHAGVVFDHRKKPVHIYRFFHPQHPAVEKEREFQAVSAACMLVKKSIFHQLGGFDEEYVNGYEDVDFCLRLKKAGYKIVYCPSCVVIHFESKTPGRFDAMAQNHSLLQKRWSKSIIRDEQRYYEEDGIRYQLLEEKMHGHTCLMHDSNPNVFWKNARFYAEQGEIEKAVFQYHEAYRFYAFDRRKLEILRELAEFHVRHGHQADAKYCFQGLQELGHQSA